jgi:hypothetical protein
VGSSLCRALSVFCFWPAVQPIMITIRFVHSVDESIRRLFLCAGTLLVHSPGHFAEKKILSSMARDYKVPWVSLVSSVTSSQNKEISPVIDPDHGRTMVCAEHYYPTRSPHANGQGINPPLQLILQPPPQCTPKRPHHTPPRATWTQATATALVQRSAYQILV